MKKGILLIALVIMAISCIEEVDFTIGAVQSTRDIVVIEATLTNEFKNHRITITRMDTINDLEVDTLINPLLPVFDIERDLVRYEKNANVVVTDDLGNSFTFEESSPGNYESLIPFSAELGVAYQLNVITSDNKSYSSGSIQIEGISSIDDIYAETIINDKGAEGIGIFVDNTPQSGDVRNLRYTYDETYKIIAPFWNELGFKLSNYDPCARPIPTYDLEIVPNDREKRVCYGSKSSNTIIQAQQTNRERTGLNRFMVRFIDRNDFILSHRYSIELTEMVTGQESFGFYESLNNFSRTGNIFSQIQPGFLEGNIAADDGSQGTVLGFFDVVSESKKRLFFNYTDFYPTDALPEYPVSCFEQSALESHTSYCFSGVQDPINADCGPLSLIENINLDLVTYFGNNDDLLVGICPGPYVFVFKVCGDCTTLGSNIVPEFWIEG